MIFCWYRIILQEQVYYKLVCLLAPVLLLFLCGWPVVDAAYAGECIQLENNKASYNVNKALYYYEDSTQKRTLQEIHKLPGNAWTGLDGQVPSYGFSRSAFWLRFEVCQTENTGSHARENAVLEVQYPLLDSVQLYGLVGDKLVQKVESGDGIPFSERPEKHRNFVFQLSVPEKETLAVYLRVETESAVQVPLKLFRADAFSEYNQGVLLLQGAYFGIILAMIIYNAFLFFSLRELPYLYYVYFTMSYFSFQAVLQGFFQQYILGSVWWQNHGLLFFGFASIAFANLFAASFLKLKSKRPKLYWGLLAIGYLSVVSAVLASMLPYIVMVKLMLAFSVLSSLLIMFAGFSLWAEGHLPARIFTIAWVTLLVSFVLASLNKFAILPRSFWTENVMQIGGILEVLLLSIALGVRINEEKQQRILVEQRLSSSLEEEVKARTLSLNKALEQLETANTILDKMSLTDSLTGLDNRRSFDKQLEIEFRRARRGDSPLALVMVDIDHFKEVNDTHGHQGGDLVLQEVAQSLCSVATRPRDRVYRYGGEEFAVLLSNTKHKGASIVAERMRKEIESLQLTLQNEPCKVTISAGIGVYCASSVDAAEGIDNRGLSMEGLVQHADGLLYQAKKNGRNRVES